MKKLLLSAAILLSLSQTSNCQSILTLPDNLSRIVTQQIQSSDANGIVLDESDQKQLIEKLNLLYTNLQSKETPDLNSLSTVSNQNKEEFKESNFPRLQSEYFGNVESVDEIYSKCKTVIGEKHSVEEVKYLVFVSYSIQIEQNYEANAQLENKRHPCGAQQYLEAAGIGFVICGPWCGTATLLIQAFSGC